MKTITVNPIKTISLVFMSIALLAGSCKKAEKGDTGPQGPSGKDGVANIKTQTFTTNTNQWVADNTNNSYYYNYSSTEISSSVLSGGAVLVYLGDGSGNVWVAMPFTTQGVEFTYGISLNTVEVGVSLSNGLMPNNPGGQQFKVVVIPPAMVKPNVNVLNYNEVKTAYGLKD